jgi:predicted nucleic acid-binding protein
VILCDTGPIVAAALVDDDHHHACVELFTGLHLAGRPLLVPGTVVAEVGYLLAREAGARVEALFLTALADGDFQLVDLTVADYRRAAELVQTYADMPLGTTDATVIALAERLGLREVATLDRRHFGVVRPSHVAALTQGVAQSRFSWSEALSGASRQARGDAMGVAD